MLKVRGKGPMGWAVGEGGGEGEEVVVEERSSVEAVGSEGGVVFAERDILCCV